MPNHGSYHHEGCGTVNNQGNLEVVMPGGHETGGSGEISRVIAFTWSTQTWRQLPAVRLSITLIWEKLTLSYSSSHGEECEDRGQWISPTPSYSTVDTTSTILAITGGPSSWWGTNHVKYGLVYWGQLLFWTEKHGRWRLDPSRLLGCQSPLLQRAGTDPIQGRALLLAVSPQGDPTLLTDYGSTRF